MIHSAKNVIIKIIWILIKLVYQLAQVNILNRTLIEHVGNVYQIAYHVLSNS